MDENQVHQEFERRRILEIQNENPEDLGYSPGAIPEVQEIRRAAIKRVDEFWKRGLRVVWQYECGNGNALMALDCLALAIGCPEELAIPRACNPKGKVPDATMVSLKHFGTKRKKFRVTKCVEMIQSALGITDGMPGQRTEEAKRNMATARKEQLT